MSFQRMRNKDKGFGIRIQVMGKIFDVLCSGEAALSKVQLS